MAMNASLANFITLYNLISTWIIGCLVLFTSILNGDIRWISNLISAFITLSIALLANSNFRNYEDIQPAECSLISTGRPKGQIDLNVLFMSHIASFMLTGSILKSTYQPPNPYLVVFFLITIFGAMGTRFSSKCNSASELILGLFIGIIAGAGWFFAWNSIDKDKFTYFNEKDDSSSEQCTRPSGQKFKCSVYKNGELIQNL